MADYSHSDELIKRLRRLEEKADRWKELTTEAAAKAGYIHSATRQFTSAYRAIGEQGADDPAWTQFVVSGEHIAGAMERALDGLAPLTEPLRFKIDNAVQLFSNASSTSVAAYNSIVPNGPIFHYQPCPFLSDSSEESYAKKLGDLDSSLGATYRAAWANQYNQQHDEGRAPLWEMRQTYDHLFGALAPDNVVRASAFWKPKQPPSAPDAVHRDERLMFAAHRWISDANSRTVLTESVKSTTEAYARLNAAHKRHALDTNKAREVFLAVDAILRRWIDSIDPWPPDLSFS